MNQVDNVNDHAQERERLMNQVDFSKRVLALVSNKLTSYFGDHNSHIPFLERKTHSNSFTLLVLNSITILVTDYTFATYKVDDANDNHISERERLISDISSAENIVLWLTQYLKFKI